MRKGEREGGETRGEVVPVMPFKQKEKRALGPEYNYSLLSGDSSERERAAEKLRKEKSRVPEIERVQRKEVDGHRGEIERAREGR